MHRPLADDFAACGLKMQVALALSIAVLARGRGFPGGGHGLGARFAIGRFLGKPQRPQPRRLLVDAPAFFFVFAQGTPGFLMPQLLCSEPRFCKFPGVFLSGHDVTLSWVGMDSIGIESHSVFCLFEFTQCRRPEPVPASLTFRARLGRDQAFPLRKFSRLLARSPDSLAGFSGPAFRRFFIGPPASQFAKETFPLELPLEEFQRLVDVVVADKDLDVVLLFGLVSNGCFRGRSLPRATRQAGSPMQY